MYNHVLGVLAVSVILLCSQEMRTTVRAAGTLDVDVGVKKWISVMFGGPRRFSNESPRSKLFK